MSNRPEIHAEIKRQVRQECYFGCVICGMPIFEYDHILEYSVVKCHTVDNLALLCDKHHNAKTGKRLSADAVAEARKNPYNKTSEKTSGYKIDMSKTVDVQVGRNNISGLFPDGTSSLSIINVYGSDFLLLNCEDGWLSMSGIFTDLEGNIVLSIDRGEIVVSTGVWDYKCVANKITINQSSRNIHLEMIFSNRHFHVNRAIFVTEVEGHICGFYIDGSLRSIEDGILRNEIHGGTFSSVPDFGIFSMKKFGRDLNPYCLTLRTPWG